MNQIGIFEAKTRLSEICDTVSRSGEAVIVTRRGQPLVRIEPVETLPLTVRERRAAYMARHPGEQIDEVDFEPPPRSDETMDFRIED